MTKQTECPTCGRDDFANLKGMRKHHIMVHGESIAYTAVECHECGEVFEKKKCDIVGKTFCSNDCHTSYLRRTTPSGEEHPDYKGGGWQNYGSNWGRQRELAIERDFGRCRMCNDDHDQLHVHHETPWEHFDSNERANRLENLLTLCPSCHAGVENSDMTP